ncbi:MAG: rRNA maturation RNase YbeY [Ruminococcaceae bacterium]|nr:rRNA maturation RNase YbeY [Oscillospiraceae bacterium]
MRKNGHDVFITNEQDIIDVTKEIKSLIVSAIAESLKYEKVEKKCEVSVTLCDNDTIHGLNREYRGVDRPTDVLSFPIFDEDDMGSKAVLGDIVLSLEKARAQAEEYGHSFEREIAFLCVHSMLHLLGYDHEEGRAQESEMFSRQEEILCNMGIAR